MRVDPSGLAGESATGASTRPATQPATRRSPQDDRYDRYHRDWERLAKGRGGDFNSFDTYAAFMEFSDMLQEASRWNLKSPPWERTHNECFDQATQLAKHLNTVFGPKYWLLRVEGGKKRRGPFPGNHNVVGVHPQGGSGNKLESMYIDAFKIKGPDGSIVEHGPFEKFKKDYPLPADEDMGKDCK